MKDFRIYIGIAALFFVIYVVAEYNQPKPINWKATFLKEDKIPLGTYVLYNRLNDIFPGSKIQTFREPAYNVINDHNINNAAYIIICQDIDLNEYDIKKITAFVKKGNDVFISAHSFGNPLNKKFHLETDLDYNPKGQIDSIHFVNKYLYQGKSYPTIKELTAVYFSEIDTAAAISLAQNQFKKSTFIKCSIGKGSLYLNTNPELLTNYSLLTPRGTEYAASVLSYIKNTKSVIWDEYYTLGREGEDSIMRVFFRNPSLKWAYYITLISLLIFVAYEMKRRQRIIPVVEPLKNSTLDFVNVVGQVYYEQRNNQNIAEKKILFLLEHIRAKYYLKTNTLNHEFVQQLSQKTGVAESAVTELFNHINYINVQSKVSDTELITLNKLIEQFYIQSR